MKSTTRGTLAAVVTCVAAAAGAAATPAAAAGTVPVPVPLDGVEKSLNVQLPKVGGELPLLTPGVPTGPQYVEGCMVPAHALPQVPIGGALPGASLHAPLAHVLGPGFDHVDVDAPASDLRTLTPGASVDTPLTLPDADHMGMPDPKLPQAAVLTPLLQTVPGALLEAGGGA
ncbi:hypothetical protein OK074_1722 [Actinobacteria bacterium OK074]|nr:hypothetical protein OK074_1722 [Actinobacteria bacterium OK074]